MEATRLDKVEIITSDLVREVAAAIVQQFDPRRVVLFGSYARGEAGPESDLDVFVEMETTRKPPERAAEVAAIFGLRPWPMDVVVYTPAEVARLRGVSGTLLDVIEREGKVLYERA